MTAPSQLSRRSRLPRIVAGVIGVGLVTYAITDDPYYGGVPGFGATQMTILVIGLVTLIVPLLAPRFAGKIVAGVMSLLLTVGAGEVLLQVAYGPYLRPTFEANPHYIFALRPGSKGEFRRSAENGGGTVRYSVNSDGYRGPELLPRAGGRRIVVYGDSFIQAIYTELEATFCGQLQRRLQVAGEPAVEVVNAGVASFGPDQVLVRMERELSGLQADLVIVSVFAGNDYGDLQRNKLFRLDDDGALRRNAWRLSDEHVQRFALGMRESNLKRFARRAKGPSTSSALTAPRTEPGSNGAALLAFLLERASDEHRDFVIDRNDVVSNVYVDFFNADCSLTPRAPSTQYRVHLMEVVMREMCRVCAELRVPLLFMFVPHPIDVCRGYDLAQVDVATYPDYVRSNATDALSAIGEKLGAPYVDLFPVFWAVDANELYYHSGDDHWNDAGQALAAERVAATIRARSMLGPQGK